MRFHALWGLVVLLLLTFVGAFAQNRYTTITPVASLSGSVADITKMPTLSPITDQATLDALWANWGIADAMPTVDFATQLVVVSTTRALKLNQTFTLVTTGNLIVNDLSSYEQGPGFRYVIAVVSNTGVTSVVGRSQRQVGPVTPERTYVGTVADPLLLADAPALITDPVTFLTLMKRWALLNTVNFSGVDFSRSFVDVQVSRENHVQPSFTLTREGDLQVAVATTPEAVEGFHYALVVVSRDGVATVNGQPLPLDTSVRIIDRYENTLHYGYRQFRVFHDKAEWDRFWDESLGKAPRSFDFTTQEVLFAEIGKQGPTRYGAYFSVVTEKDDALIANLVETKPGPALTLSTSPTYPYTFAVIPKSNKPVYFISNVVDGAIMPVVSSLTTPDSLQETAENLVIKDVARWKELYAKRMPAGTPLPEVNFGENMVLAVFAGALRQGGSVTMTQTVEKDGVLQVEYYVIRPPMVAGEMIVTHPWAAIVVSKSEATVSFTEVEGPPYVEPFIPDPRWQIR
jgi:hypothetical protein